MKRLIYLGVLITATVGGIWFSKLPNVPEMKQLPLFSKQAVRALVVKGSVDRNKLSKAELDEFTSYFGANSSRKSFHWITKVMPGEVVITEGYQGRSGELVFSKVTPLLKQNEQGKTVVEIRNDSFAVTVSGQQRSVINRPMVVRLGETARWSAFTQNGECYRTLVTATLEDASGMLIIESRGDYNAIGIGQSLPSIE